MLTPHAQLTQSLSGTSSVTVTHLYGLGREAISAADIVEWPFAQIIETLDNRTCPLCRRLHGLILAKTDPRYHQYKYPSHIGCRRIMVDIGKGELGDDGKPLLPDFRDPPKALLEKHGHFHIDPDKYSALRIPSRPEGRDFIYVPGKGGAPHKLIWRAGLSDEARRATIKDMLGEIIRDPETLRLSANLLRQLGLWATEEADFSNLALALSHRDDWPGLKDDLGFTELAYRLTALEDTAVCALVVGGAYRFGYWRSAVMMPGYECEDVALILDPATGQLTDLRRRPKSWFFHHRGFLDIAGFAPL